MERAMGEERAARPPALRLDASAPRAVGDITFYRLYDVGYEIDLEQATTRLAEHAPERPRPQRGEAQAIQIPNPPVTVRLGTDSGLPPGGAPPVELSARIFDFGVVSLRGRIPVDAPRAWDDLARLGAQAGTGPEWAACFARGRDQLIDRIRPAIQRPGDSGIVEDYTLFRFQALSDASDRPVPVSALTDPQIASLLFGESRPLSPSARGDLLSQRFSYFEDDLAVLAWNAALIVEPGDDTDVSYVLEFANAQLLELRYYDSVLDRQIPHIYDEIAAARRAFHLIGRRYGRVLASLQRRVADATELIERVENSLKVTDDVYLARIYATALEIFRGRTWRGGIERKVAIVREAYGMLNAESVERRGEVLEITIVVLIAVELVLALMRR